MERRAHFSAASAAAAMMASSPQPPQPQPQPLPLPQPQPQHTTLMQVQVPSGMSGGMSLRIRADGHLLQVQIPAGLGPGALFQVARRSGSKRRSGAAVKCELQQHELSFFRLPMPRASPRALPDAVVVWSWGSLRQCWQAFALARGGLLSSPSRRQT